MSMFKWDVVDPAPGQPVAPDQRLPWGKTIGIGAQHVVAMFGATFVFPIVMGLDPNLAILLSGIATICFLLIVKGEVPSYLGTTASFVGGAPPSAPRAADPAGRHRRDPGLRRRARAVGVVVHFLGADVVNAVLPPVVTGGVVMVIGFNLAPVSRPASTARRPLDGHHHHDRGHADGGRPARVSRPDRDLPRPDLRLPALLALRRDLGNLVRGVGRWRHDRVNWDRVKAADWIGFPRHTADGWSATRRRHLDRSAGTRRASRSPSPCSRCRP